MAATTTTTTTLIADVHARLSPAAGLDAARLVRLLNASGVAHAVAFSAEACHGQLDEGNRAVLAEVDSAEALSALVVADPAQLQASRDWVLHRAPDNPKVVGVKLDPVLGHWELDSPACARFLDEVLSPSGLPALIHAGRQWRRPIDLALAFPHIRFLVVGCGMTPPEAPHNLWFVSNGSGAGALAAAVGRDNLCFGTGAPLYAPPAVVPAWDAIPAWENALNALPALRSRVAEFCIDCRP